MMEVLPILFYTRTIYTSNRSADHMNNSVKHHVVRLSGMLFRHIWRELYAKEAESSRLGVNKTIKC